MWTPILFAIAATTAATPETHSRYEACVALIETDVALGRVEAQKWAGRGGGSDAQHCLALADIAAGFPKLGAARLQDIAQRKDAGDDFVRARLLAQASEAWLSAGKLDAAKAAIDAAFLLVPEAGELYLTAAKIDGARNDWQSAVNTVGAAEDAGFVAADTYVIRARAYIAFGDYQRAAEDVVRALNIEPANLDALVLRGEIQQAGVVIEVYYDDPATED